MPTVTLETGADAPADADRGGAGCVRAAPGSPLVHRLAVLAAVVTYCGVVVGGVVTSTESGLADTSWPSFAGEWLPSLSEMAKNAGLRVEHGHRLLMGTAGILAVLLAVIAHLGHEPRRGARRLALAAALLVLPPAVFGGLAVLGRLHPALSIVHVALAMLFLSALAALAVVTGRRWHGETARLEPARLRGLEELAVAAAASIYVQIVLGAVPRHATADAGGRAMVTIGNLLHIGFAFAVVTVVLLLAGRVVGLLSKVQSLLRPAAALFLLVLVEVFLGFAAFISQPKDPAPVVAEAPGLVASGPHETVASIHQAVGVLTLVVALVLALRACRVRRLSLAGATAAGEGRA